ncbi:MAG: cysteine synthase family protein [Firmicutes bacterium]|nr:cysteine synthase family protein [Bacillota bacterium]
MTERPRALTSVLAAIGNTPVVRLRKLVDDQCADVFVKLEWMNPGGSVKDRMALAVIEDARKSGRLRPGDIAICADSGNFAISLAMVCAVIGQRLLLVMPDDVAAERKSILRAYGVELRYTEARLGHAGAQDVVRTLCADNPGAYFELRPHDSGAVVTAYEAGLGAEIVDQMAGQLDVFVSGVGTGATLTGVGRALRDAIADCDIVAVEPAESPVMAGGNAGVHGIIGIGPGFVPPLLDRKLIDSVRQVSTAQAYACARDVARREGVLVGISSGANIAAAIAVARERGPGHRVLTVSASCGERYLHTPLYREG